MRFLGCLFLLIISAPATYGQGELRCDQNIVEHRKPARAYVPFTIHDIHDPETGASLGLAQEIKIPTEPGKPPLIMPAGDFLIQVNSLEEKLAPWGYSLRDVGQANLGEIQTCIALLASQADRIEEQLRKEKPLTQKLDDFSPRFDEAWKRYKDDIPSWEEMRKRADNQAYNVYLPPKPSLAVVPPVKQRVELKPMIKERPWPFNFGEGKDLHVWGQANFRVDASKVEAKAKGTLVAEGEVLGQRVGEIVSILANAESPGTGEMLAELKIAVLGSTIFSPRYKGAVIKDDQDQNFPVEYGMDYRFAIGPIPMRARFGFQGKVGLLWGYNILPLRIGTYTKPYIRTNAYAQVGADVGVGGVGAAGELTLVNLDVPVTADVYVEWNDEPQLKLEIVGSTELDALSGRIYAYVYVYYPMPLPPWRKKWEGDWTFFSWDGIKRTGNIFEYKATLTSAGLVASGDLTADDVAEIEGINAEARVIQLENASKNHAYAVLKSVADDFASVEEGRAIRVAIDMTALNNASLGKEKTLREDLETWLQRELH